MQQAPHHTPNLDGDQEIVARLRLGDQTAVSEMYGRYARYVASIAYRLMGSDADLDDIVQDTFVSVVKGIQKLKDAAVFKTWIATIAVRTTRRYAEMGTKQRYIAEQKMRIQANASPPIHSVSIEVRELMAQIPYKYRAPWILCKVMEMNLAETSSVCGCSLATTKRRIGKAEKQIRRIRDES